MARPQIAMAHRIGHHARWGLGRIEVLALFPLIVLTADWFGFANIALVTAFGLCGLLACALILPARRADVAATRDAGNGKAALLDALETVGLTEGRDTICLMIEIDKWSDITATWGFDTAQDIAQRTEDRLKTALRSGDVMCKLGDARFGVVLASMPTARLGIRDTAAQRRDRPFVLTPTRRQTGRCHAQGCRSRPDRGAMPGPRHNARLYRRYGPRAQRLIAPVCRG
jgi:hypothetical protein